MTFEQWWRQQPVKPRVRHIAREWAKKAWDARGGQPKEKDK